MNRLKRTTARLEDFNQQFGDGLATKSDEQRRIRLVYLRVILAILSVLWYFLH